MPESGYPLIADHGLIGDLQTAALVATDGTIDWFCAPAVRLAEHLRRAAGPRARRPLPDPAAADRLRHQAAVLPRHRHPGHPVHDRGRRRRGGRLHAGRPAPTATDRHRLVRVVRCVRGQMTFDVEVAPAVRLRREASTRLHADRGRRGLRERRHGDDAAPRPRAGRRAAGSMRVDETATTCTATLTLQAGQVRGVVLETGRPGRRGRSAPAEVRAAVRRHGRVLAVLAGAVDVHRPLAGDAGPLGDHPEADDLRPDAARWSPRRPPGCPSRSAASATGTTATPGSATPRSRCTPCSGWASPRRPRPSGRWLRDRVAEHGRQATAGPLKIMYRVDGSSDLTEEVLDALGGLPRAPAPVRIGNGAADQLQLDIYGEALDSVYLADQHGLAGRPPGLAGASATCSTGCATTGTSPRRASGRPAAAARTSPTAG